MPPRHAYWTIIVGNLPTAFRAAQREELLPTFEQLRRKHPDAVLRWFARGRLWDSPEAARERPAPAPTTRGRDWRPGGTHRDPRDRFRKERQARWQAVRERSYQKRAAGERRDGPNRPSRRPPEERPAPQLKQERPAQRPTQERPKQERPARGPTQERPTQERPAPRPTPERPPRPVPDPPDRRPHEEIVVPGRPPERGTRRREGSTRAGGRPPHRGPKRR